MRRASLLSHWTVQEHPLYNMLVIETLPHDAHHNEYNPSGAVSTDRPCLFYYIFLSLRLKQK